MKACPKCKSESKHRMRRPVITRLIPGAIAYACDDCSAQYTWISGLNLSLKN